MSTPVRSRSLIGLMVLLAAAPLRAASVPVAVSGDSSPLGLPFSSFGNLALMADGRVAFLGSATGAFRRTDEGLVHIVAAGDVLADGAVVAGVSPPALGPGGCVALRAFLVSGGSRVLRHCGGATDVVAATGDPAPGGGVLAEVVGGVAYSGGGQIGFAAVLEDGSTALFLASGGVVTAIARPGLGAPSGGVLTGVRLVGVTADGRVGFRGAVADGRDGLFLGSGGPLRRVVEVGEATPVGGVFQSVGGASLNDAGSWTFRGEVTQGGGRAGVFRVDTGGALPRMQAIALEGDRVGGDSSLTIRTMPSSLTPSINSSGMVAFRATLSGGETGSAVFVAPPGAPPASVLEARERSLVRFRDPVIADDSSLVVPASTTGGGPGLFVYRAGAFSALVQVGDATDLDTGQERFRFAQPSVRESAETAAFSGSRQGIFLAGTDGPPRRLAFVGGPTPLRGTFAGFDPPAANAPGRVVFGAEIRGGQASRAIITVGGDRGPKVVARSSQRVRGGALVDFFVSTIDSLTRPDVGPRGEIAFEGTMEGGRTPRALFLRRSGPPQPVVRAGKDAPGGGEFEGLGTPAVLRGGKLAFVAQVGGGESSRPKIFLRLGSRTRVVAARGSGAPGRLGGRFDAFDPPDANDTLVAFRATVGQGGEGLFLASPRRLGLLVGTRDPAPGGGVFRGFSAPALGGAHAVFLGRLIGSTAPPGLYRVRADAVPAAEAPAPAVELLVLPGAPSPLGGRVAEIESFSANRGDALAVVVDLVGATASSALLLLDPGSALVP